MNKCKLCGRLHDPEVVLPHYLNVRPRNNKESWASDVCDWCWIDFEHLNREINIDVFNKHCSEQMTALAKRAARGASLLRCEAICLKNNGQENIPSHRCAHFAIDDSKPGPKLCGVHALHVKSGRRVETCLPSPPRFFLAAANAEEFATEILRCVPPEWAIEVARRLQEGDFDDKHSAA